MISSLTIKALKFDLYANLLSKGSSMTENELDIMYYLSKDEEIQGWLEERKMIGATLYLVEGDHPIGKRIYERHIKSKADKLVKELQEFGYENIKIDGKEIPNG